MDEEFTPGTVSALSTSLGHLKLSFDPNDPVERLRAARVVTDMLRRGYALMIEVVKPDGEKAFQRVQSFDEERCEYIVADLDPSASEQGQQFEQLGRLVADKLQDVLYVDSEGQVSEEIPVQKSRGRPKKSTKRLPAETSKVVAVARTAGG